MFMCMHCFFGEPYKLFNVEALKCTMQLYLSLLEIQMAKLKLPQQCTLT